MLKLQLGIAGSSLPVWVLEASKSLVQLDVTSHFPLRRMRAITHLLSEHFAGAGPPTHILYCSFSQTVALNLERRNWLPVTGR